MRDKDAHLIFESYLNSKSSEQILEADEKKWEDESSAWAWVKVFDPTGLSSWPDVYDAALEVRDNKKDIWPWLKFLFNVFLALPNFGVLAFGAGAAGWASLRVLSKAALKGGEKEGLKVAEKIIKIINESNIMRSAFNKITKQLEKQGVLSAGEINTMLNMIKQKGVLAVGKQEALVGKAVRSSIGDGMEDTFLKSIQLPKTATRAGAQLTGAATNWFGDDGDKKEEDTTSTPKTASPEKTETSTKKELPSIKRKEETKPSQSSAPKTKKKYGDEFPEL